MIRRRRLSCLSQFLLAFGLCGLTSAASAQTGSDDTPPPTTATLPLASGIVFEDRNGNRRRDPGEPGLAGVSVSNGLDVVRTDADGRYSLAVAEGDVVFVTKPAGTAPPVDRDMTPQFHYVHDPDGPAVAMGRSPRVDPLVAKLRLRIPDRLVNWTPPRDSTHIWAAPLPRDLAPGVRRITIRAVDEYGQEQRSFKLVEIEG